jgi:hypothetical protein
MKLIIATEDPISTIVKSRPIAADISREPFSDLQATDLVKAM